MNRVSTRIPENAIFVEDPKNTLAVMGGGSPMNKTSNKQELSILDISKQAFRWENTETNGEEF